MCWAWVRLQQEFAFTELGAVTPPAPARVEPNVSDLGYVAECLRIPNGLAPERRPVTVRAAKFPQVPALPEVRRAGCTLHTIAGAAVGQESEGSGGLAGSHLVPAEIRKAVVSACDTPDPWHSASGVGRKFWNAADT